MIALLLMVAAQPAATIEPGIYTAEQICRPYLGEQAVISSSPDVEDRCFVTHLKERTWEQVQGLLGEGYGIEVVSTGENQWLVRLDEETASQLHKEANEVLDIVANAVQRDARAILKEMNVDSLADLQFHLGQLEANLVPKASGYKQSEVQRFIAENADDLDRAYLLSLFSDRSRWVALQEAAHSGSQAVRSRKRVEVILPAAAYLDRVKMADLDGPHLVLGKPTGAKAITRFSWTNLTPFTELRVLSPGGEEHLLDSIYMGKVSAQEVAEKFPSDQDKTLAVLDSYEPAGKLFKNENGDQPSGLSTQLLNWTQQVDGEIIAEINPLADVGGMPTYGQPKGKTLRAVLAGWIGNRQFTELQSSFYIEGDEILDLDDAFYQLWKKRYWGQHIFINDLYSATEAQLSGDVLLLSLPQQPLLSLLPLPQPEYWSVVADNWSADSIREYVRKVSPSRHRQWLNAFGTITEAGSSYSLVNLYPALRTLEDSGQAAKQFWGTLEADGQATVSLSPAQARPIWQYLIDSGLPFGEAEMAAGSGVEIYAKRVSFANGSAYMNISYHSSQEDLRRASGSGDIYFRSEKPSP